MNQEGRNQGASTIADSRRNTRKLYSDLLQALNRTADVSGVFADEASFLSPRYLPGGGRGTDGESGGRRGPGWSGWDGGGPYGS